MDTKGRWGVSDPEVEKFFDSCVTSFAAWDLLICMNRKPEIEETLPRLAQVLGRQESDMIPAVGALVDSEVVVETETSDGTAYRLSDDPELRDLVDRFLKMASRRDCRLEFVRRILSRATGM